MLREGQPRELWHQDECFGGKMTFFLYPEPRRQWGAQDACGRSVCIAVVGAPFTDWIKLLAGARDAGQKGRGPVLGSTLHPRLGQSHLWVLDLGQGGLSALAWFHLCLLSMVGCCDIAD